MQKDMTGTGTTSSAEQIKTVLYQYARGVDRRNWDLVRDTYHEDAYDDHGGYKGGRSGLLEWLKRRHATIEQSMHFIGNCIIEYQSDDRALVETYCTVYQRYGHEAKETIRTWLGDQSLPEGKKIKVDLVCRYVDVFSRRDGKWRIADRTVVMEEVKMMVDEGRLNSAHALARRDADDTLWKKERELRAAIASRG